MKKTLIVLVSIVLLILVFIFGMLLGNGQLTGKTVTLPFLSQSISFSPPLNDSLNYSYTKAICNDQKCIDVLIECKNGTVTKLTPMTDLIDLNNVSAVNTTQQFC